MSKENLIGPPPFIVGDIIEAGLAAPENERAYTRINVMVSNWIHMKEYPHNLYMMKAIVVSLEDYRSFLIATQDLLHEVIECIRGDGRGPYAEETIKIAGMLDTLEQAIIAQQRALPPAEKHHD